MLSPLFATQLIAYYSWLEATPTSDYKQWERTSMSYFRPELKSKAFESHLAAIFERFYR
jgi:hypothetical protein